MRIATAKPADMEEWACNTEYPIYLPGKLNPIYVPGKLNPMFLPGKLNPI